MLSALLEKIVDRVARDRFEITRSWIDGPYMTRWAIAGKLDDPKPATFVHWFQRSDADEMHDHPWPFTTMIIAGGYYEVTPARGWKNGVGPVKKVWYNPGRILRRPANWIHRIEIPAGRDAWTIVSHGEKQRAWGFWCPMIGWRPWREHLRIATANDGHGCA